MSKSIVLTQYAEDGSVVHITIDTGDRQQAMDFETGQPVFSVLTASEDSEEIREPVMVAVTQTYSFGPMPQFTDASGKTRVTIEAFVAQCEAEVQALIDAEAAPVLIERRANG